MKAVLGVAIIGVLFVFFCGIQRQFAEHDIVEESLFGFMYGCVLVLVFMAGNGVGCIIKSLR